MAVSPHQHKHEMVDVNHGIFMRNPCIGEPDHGNACLVLALAGAIERKGNDASCILEGLVEELRPRGGSEVLTPMDERCDAAGGPLLDRRIAARLRVCGVRSLAVYTDGVIYHTFMLPSGSRAGIEIAINLLNWAHWVERVLDANDTYSSSTLGYSESVSYARVIADGSFAEALAADELATEEIRVSTRLRQELDDGAAAAAMHAAEVADAVDVQLSALVRVQRRKPRKTVHQGRNIISLVD